MLLQRPDIVSCHFFSRYARHLTPIRFLPPCRRWPYKTTAPAEILFRRSFRHRFVIDEMTSCATRHPRRAAQRQRAPRPAARQQSSGELPNVPPQEPPLETFLKSPRTNPREQITFVPVLLLLVDVLLRLLPQRLPLSIC